MSCYCCNLQATHQLNKRQIKSHSIFPPPAHFPSKSTSPFSPNPNSIASELIGIQKELEKSLMREQLVTVKTYSRKRKKSSPSLANSNPLTSVFTRSKSRIFYHHNRSGFSRPDRRVIGEPITEMESVEAFLGVNRRSKDLRHKRVFSPGVDLVPDQENEETNDERKKLLKGFDSSTVGDVDDVKAYELGKCGIVDERIAGANGPKWMNEAIPGNGSLPNMKMALNGCNRKKVFKTPSSFSYRRLLPHLMDIVNDTTSVSKIEFVDAGSPCKFPKLDGVDFELRSTADNSYRLKTEYFESKFDDWKKDYIEFDASTIQPNVSSANNELAGTVKEKDHENDTNGVDASVEENIQTTPPDSDILARTEVVHGRESEDAKKVLGENQMSMGLSVGSEKSSNGALKQSPNTKCSTNSMSKSVINPCSRLRLFKNPRSLSYRRLLPFLMDISKTDSCTSKKPQQKIPQVVYKEDRLPAPATSVENNYVDDTMKENPHEKIYSEDMIQTASDGSSPDSNNNPVPSILERSPTNYSSNIDPRSDNSPTLSDLGSQADLEKLQLDLRSKESSSISESPSVVGYLQAKQCTSGESRSVEKQNMCLSTGLEVHNGNSELTESKQHSIQIKTTDALISPDNRSFKGILKRNRRGCRGLCNCLNCASFRLHAERAFEFSRNQLHDAEEVASELMKELANLRLLLEKTINGKEDSASIQPYPVIIKEACNKAIEAETLAKERLVELNNDLSLHCRIPDLLQPKVTFTQ